MPFAVDDARVYVAKVRWQFASTMPRIPHWYTLRKWRPELDDDFVSFVLLIREIGEQRPWPDPPAPPRYHNHYLEIDGWKYWTMGAPVHYGASPFPDREDSGSGETILINRARVDGPTT
jgi:hypothetical protein